MNDLKFALRQLLKNPAFTAVAVLTLALGIGANTAIFTALYALVWRPLPVKDPAAVVNLHQSFAGPSFRRAIGGINRLSYPEYLNYRDRTRSLAGLLAFEDGNFTFGDAKTSRVTGVLATGNYFSVLGATPELGRLWSAAECEVPGASPLVVLSHGFWQRQFGGDRGVVGRTVFLNHRTLTVIGVTTPDFRGTELLVPDMWLPITMRDQVMDEPGRLAARDYSWLRIVGRLKPGVSLAEARRELAVVALQSDGDAAITAWPARKTQMEVKPGAYFNSPEDMRNGLPVVLVVMVVIGLVLVVVCANVSNLLLARATARRREIGVRLALGAGRARLVRQLMKESLLLSGIAGVVGLALAFSLPRLLFNLLPPEALPALDFSPNLAVLGYCSAISLLAALCVGLAPALHATRLDLASMLSAQGTPPGQRLGRHPAAQWLGDHPGCRLDAAAGERGAARARFAPGALHGPGFRPEKPVRPFHRPRGERLQARPGARVSREPHRAAQWAGQREGDESRGSGPLHGNYVHDHRAGSGRGLWTGP